MSQVNFSSTQKDYRLIRQIATRAVEMDRDNTPFIEFDMDITACHLNGCRLRLADLLAADDFNFAHDVFGIGRHIDRDTGKLDGRFLPRFNNPKKRLRLSN